MHSHSASFNNRIIRLAALRRIILIRATLLATQVVKSAIADSHFPLNLNSETIPNSGIEINPLEL
jgi:hypothetical protein